MPKMFKLIIAPIALSWFVTCSFDPECMHVFQRKHTCKRRLKNPNLRIILTLTVVHSFHNNLLPRSLHTNVATCLKKIRIYTLTLPDLLLTIYRSHYARINIKLFSIFCTGPTLYGTSCQLI